MSSILSGFGSGRDSSLGGIVAHSETDPAQIIARNAVTRFRGVMPESSERYGRGVPFEARRLLPTQFGSAVPEDAAPVLELSVVMPCLNEADTLAACIQKAWRAMADHGIVGEIIVADNGSTDGSPEIAAALGARVVHVGARGYGNALMGGIAASVGRFVVIGDASRTSS